MFIAQQQQTLSQRGSISRASPKENETACLIPVMRVKGRILSPSEETCKDEAWSIPSVPAEGYVALCLLDCPGRHEHAVNVKGLLTSGSRLLSGTSTGTCTTRSNTLRSDPFARAVNVVNHGPSK